MERRVHKWKIQHDVQQEVDLPQVHLPGDVIAFDFVDLNVLGVTLNGQQFDHKLFHATLNYSNWQHIQALRLRGNRDLRVATPQCIRVPARVDNIKTRGKIRTEPA